MPLGNKEGHYWKPIPKVVDWLCHKVIKPTDRVLDVGCGHCPFPRGDVAVDKLTRDQLEGIWKEMKIDFRPPKMVQHDFLSGPMPFADKEFDFVFCRHTLEDMFDPFMLLWDMRRVGRAGYIETPSPIAELTRGVDGYEAGTAWRGYYHHRWFVWVHEGKLWFQAKQPIVEHVQFDAEDALADALRGGPELWNTYYVWKDEPVWKCNDDPRGLNFLEEYRTLLWSAGVASARATEAFCNMVNEQMDQKAA